MISADFKQKIHGKKPLKGTFVKMNCPTAVEALGLAGLDFIIIDGEHAPLDEMHLEAMLRAADCVGLPVVVRVPVADEFHILKVLDMGAARRADPRPYLHRGGASLSGCRSVCP